MELAIPLVAMAGLYMVSKQQNTSNDKTTTEGFEDLPNTNLPNINFPDENDDKSVPPELANTGRLTHNNAYDGTAYTDHYFKGNHNQTTDATDAVNQSHANGQTYKTLGGDTANKDHFKHNNMVPFFGRKKTTRDFNADQNEGILDNYLGNGSNQIEKKEQAPLFAPNDNTQWAYGLPNQNDFLQSRVNPSQKMANVLPFSQEKVAPGIGLGAGTEGMAGYNSGMLNREAWMPKTVDDLRVNNHRKAAGVSMLGREGPANSIIKEMGHQGIQEKHRPERTAEWGHDRLFTTTGAESRQPLHPKQEDRYTTRPETTTSYTGNASAQNTGTFVDGEYMESKRIDLGAVPYGNASATGRGNINEGDYGAKSHTTYANNRTANTQSDYFGAIGGAIGAVISPVMDIIRPSRNENTIGTLRPYQNAGATTSNSYVFNPADRPSTTIRETTENSKFHMNSGTSEMNKGGYLSTNVQPIANNRMDQSDYYYAGNASAGDGTREVRPYDAEYRQRNNDTKSLTINSRTNQGNMALLNHDMNVVTKDKTGYLTNQRPPAPKTAQQIPNMETMGRLQGKTELYAGMQNDRAQGEILNQLKQNPYALSITS